MSDKKSDQDATLSMAMPVDKTVTRIKVPTALKPAADKLKLDTEGQRPAKTRAALYKELTKDERVKEDEDYFEFSHPTARVVGFAIDFTFAAAIIKAAIMAAPIELKMFHLFILDKYRLDFIFGETFLLQLLIGLSIAAALFFFVVVPVAFFNVSVGKKLTGQRVRGDGKYTISISQAFKREIIYKPIGLACLASFILPFYDKKKKTLHDKLANTFVIKE